MFFIGHRDAPASLLPLLIDAVEKHIVDYGVTEFVVGHYGNFDKLAAQAVISAKSNHPEISLLLLLPYHPAERPVNIPLGFDGTYYPERMEQVPRNLAIIRANRYMTDHVDYIIAYARHPASNARTLVDYARRRAERGLISVQNLAEYDESNLRKVNNNSQQKTPHG